jgi:hypothetical protein
MNKHVFARGFGGDVVACSSFSVIFRGGLFG